MKIIQISDLHITEKENKKDSIFEFDEELIKNRIRQFNQDIKNSLYKGETIIFLVIGDIIHYDGSYSLAELFFDTIKVLFSEYELEFIFVPGNHDLNLINKGKELIEFDKFISKYTKETYEFNSQSLYIKEVEGTVFNLINSVYEKNECYGKVDIVEFRRKVVAGGIIVCHHYIHPVGESDTSPIINFDEFKEEIQSNNIEFCLMGHVHISKNVDVLNGVNYIASPKLFNNIGALSFNIIDVNNGEISKIEQHSYYKDILCKRCEPIFPIKKEEKLGIKKQNYEEVQNYIPRSVSIIDETNHILSTSNDIFELITVQYEETNAFILLSQAAKGKTLELQQLAYRLSKNEDKYPLLVSLYNYTDEDIKDIPCIFSNHYFQNSKNIYLLFDGYDEIDIDNQITFAKKLNSFRVLFPNIKIIVSSRSNFYNNKFDNYKKMFLNNLSVEDIKQIATKNSVDYDSFIEKIESQFMSEFLYSPFYTLLILDLYKENNVIPSRKELTETKINNIIEHSRTHHDIDDSIVIINESLIKLAYIMQAMGKSSINNIELERVIINKDDRNIIKQSGIFEKNEEMNWKFAHKNFQDYYAACYLNSRTRQEVIDLIMNQNTINMKWLNTITHYLYLSSDSEILNHFCNDEQIVLLERQWFSDKERIKVFNNFIDNYSRKNVWISRALVSWENIMEFCTCEEVICSLLRELEQSQNNYFALSNAILLITNAKDLYSKGELVKDCLYNICFNDSVRNHEKELAISALAKLKLFDEEKITILMDNYKKNSGTSIHWSVFKLLNEYNKDKLVYYIIDFLHMCIDSNLSVNGNVVRMASITGYLMGNINNHNIKPLTDVLIAKSDNFTHIIDKELVEFLVNEHKVIYDNEPNNTEYLEYLIESIITSEYSKIYGYNIGHLLKESGLSKAVYNILLKRLEDKETWEWEELFLFEDILDDELIKDYSKKFMNDGLNNLKFAENIISRRSQSFSVINGLSVIYKSKFNTELIISKKVDYVLERKKGNQLLFDAFFDKSQFQVYIEEMLALLGNKRITYKELIDNWIELNSGKFHLNRMQHIIYQVFKDSKYNDKLVCNFLSELNWESFAINYIYKYLKEDKENKLIITEAQVQYIKYYCDKNIKNCDFKCKCTSDNSSTSWVNIYIIYFILRFKFECDDNTFLDMLLMDKHFLSIKENHKIENCFGNIEKTVSADLIKQRVKYNIDNASMGGAVLMSHINYCMKSGMLEGIPLSKVTLTNNCVDDYQASIIVEYLLLFKEYEFLLKNEILDNYKYHVYTKIFNTLVKEYSDKKKLLKIITNKYTISNDVCLINYIITLNNVRGIKEYYKIIKGKMATIESQDYQLKESIPNIKDIKCIFILLRIGRLLFNDKFKIDQFSSLYGNVRQAITNILENNPKLISILLKIYANRLFASKEFRAYCYGILNDYSRNKIYKHNNDMNLDDAISFFAEHNK